MNAVIELNKVSKRYFKSTERPYYLLREEIAELISWPRKLLSKHNDTETGKLRPGEFWALRDVTFSVKPGEILGVIGSNGAGKSTLLKILSRITVPSEGSLVLRGKISSLLEVGTGFHPELTGRENIFLNGAILGMKQADIRKRFDEIVEFSGVASFLDMPIKHYSSGMHMRLAFSIASILDSDILLVDEVLAVGDAEFQKKSLGVMEKITKGQGRTVVFVSHNLSAVRRLCDRCLLLENGRVTTIGRTEEVVGKYLSRVEKTQPQVNISRIRDEIGTLEVRPISIKLLNSVGRSFAIPWDQPIKLEIKFKAREDTAKVSFGIGCTTVDGFPVFTVRSTDKSRDQSIDVKKGQTQSLTVSIGHNLRAGYYNLVLGIYSGDHIFYYNPSVCQLTVLRAGKKIYIEENTGVINCDSKWQV